MANNLLLTVILVVVLAGTLWPLALEGLNGAKISVGAPYFNSAAGPLALILMALMAAGPLLRWRSDRPGSAAAAHGAGAARRRGDVGCCWCCLAAASA